MPYDNRFLDANAAYERILNESPGGDGGSIRIYNYLPDPFIALIQENMKLRADVQRLRVYELKWQDEMRAGMTLLDKLRYAAGMLEEHGERLPFRLDSTPR